MGWKSLEKLFPDKGRVYRCSVHLRGILQDHQNTMTGTVYESTAILELLNLNDSEATQ